MADAMMMGVGKPAGVAFSNGAKLAVIAVALPLLLPRYGMTAALLVFVLADAVRYALLAWSKRGGGLSLLRPGAAFTLSFFLLVFLFTPATIPPGPPAGCAFWFGPAELPLRRA